MIKRPDFGAFFFARNEQSLATLTLPYLPLLALISPYLPLLALICPYLPLFILSQQIRAVAAVERVPKGAIAIEDCWLWLMPAESSLSKIGIGQGQRFAIANNSPHAD